MRLPSFPSDFRVLYSEGASYWWWSPDTGSEWDGHKLADDPSPWPTGLVIGNGDTSHELVVGEEAVVIWTDFGDTHEILGDEPFVYSTDAGVQSVIDRFFEDAVSASADQ